MTHADELVARYILRKYRELNSTVYSGEPTTYLAGCGEAVVTDPDASNGTYGCDTGCDYYTLTATISCPHGETRDYEYGDFGEISYLIEELEEEDAGDHRSAEGPERSDPERNPSG